MLYVWLLGHFFEKDIV